MNSDELTSYTKAFAAELVENQILRTKLEDFATDYGLEWAGGAVEYTVDAISCILSDCLKSSRSDLWDLSLGIGIVPSPRETAIYFANSFANTILMIAISENAQQITRGHCLLAIRKVKPFAWNGLDYPLPSQLRDDEFKLNRRGTTDLDSSLS
ncbi:MAG: hypothetical protein PVJ38_06515 [Candidatus Bathyarchaeota archaeon]|jgi:hypothetical protein